MTDHSGERREPEQGTGPRHAVLATVVRSGLVESVHSGSLVVLDAAGGVVAAAGEPSAVVLPRSALKPLQAAAMLRAGLVLDGPLLALAAASHSGERYHLDGVVRILARGGLSPDALRTPASLPLDEDEALAWRMTGRAASALGHNCSGKHAAMLLTCHENGWPLDTYLHPGHPLQQHIVATVAELAAEQVAGPAVDGCGAPALGISLTGLARAFSRLALAAPGSPEGRVSAAVRARPEWLGGTGRAVTRLITAVPGLVAKDGAEAVFAAALPDGGAVAVKIADGGTRPLLPVVVAALRRLSITVAGPGDPAELDDLGRLPVLGGGERVGSVVVTGV